MDEIDEIKQLTESFVRKARLKLSSAKYRFFSLCLYPIRTIVIDDPRPLEGYINYESNSERFENQIHINQQVIGKYKHTYKTLNMIDIMLHELNHIIRRHDIRGIGKNKDLWNTACDHIVDLSLKKLKLSLPIIQYNIIKTIEYNDDLKSEEAVYRWLLKQKKNDGIDISKDSKGMISLDEKSRDQQLIIAPDLSDKDIKPEKQQIVEDYVSKVRAIYNIEKEKGNISNDMKSLFDELLKVDIPWERLLEKAIKAKAVEKANRRNWRKLNKYYVNLDINLPGAVSSYDKDAVSTLIVHIDSSGSMSDDDLRKAGYVIVKSAKYFEKIILIIADVNLKQEVIFRKLEYDSIMNYFKDAGVTGRGGTSHKFVFKYFDKFYEENPDNLSLTISITDCYSDIDNRIKTAEFIKAVPLILINTSGKKVINHKNITNIVVN
jgi:predicted metal-dependent peptidase